MLTVVATTLDARRLRALQSQVGSAPVLAALKTVIALAAKGFPAALQHQLKNFAWLDLFDQLDEVLPDEETDGQPER